MVKYNAIKNHNLNVEIEIENIGNVKANDLRVNLEFPNELLIYKKKEIEKLKFPEALAKGVNPIEKLIIANFNLNGYSQIANTFENLFYRSRLLDSINVTSLLGDDMYDSIEDNKLYVKG